MFKLVGSKKTEAPDGTKIEFHRGSSEQIDTYLYTHDDLRFAFDVFAPFSWSNKSDMWIVTAIGHVALGVPHVTLSEKQRAIAKENIAKALPLIQCVNPDAADGKRAVYSKKIAFE